MNVRVASFSDISLISPYGSNPNLISAWNPLQIPIIKPSLLSNKSLIAAFNLGFLKTVAINLPEPSGSSPAENPPGSITILARLMAFSNSSIDVFNISSVLFLINTSSTLAPAFSKARFESYSQFVPGNTGITTNGVSIYCFAFKVDLVLHSATLISCVGAFSLVG